MLARPAATKSAPSSLRRYTDLPSLLHILASKQITLLDPHTWDDKNDSHYMGLYKEGMGFKTLLALCFSQASETYHHWRVFSSGPSGVCIIFKREQLLMALAERSGITSGDVKYRTLKEAKECKPTIDELPFFKRKAFQAEREHRVIYGSTTESLPALSVSIPIDCIRSVSLSPWLHPSLRDATAAAIRSVDRCAKLNVSRSTLVSNEQWKSLGSL